MAWLKFLKKDNPASDSRVLRDELFNAAGTGDEAAFDTMCLVNRDRIVCEFKTWQKVPAPVRADREALARYAHGLTAVADWFARNDAPQLMEAFRGEELKNPSLRWKVRFGEADALKAQSRFTEAGEILEDLAKGISSCRGSAVERYLPMVHGSLGECFFRSGRFDRAYETTRAALDGCQRSGDIEGIIAYCGNLAEICAVRGEADEARYWLIVTTNAMIQTGESERAAEVRRQHGLEPVEGLIVAKRPQS